MPSLLSGQLAGALIVCAGRWTGCAQRHAMAIDHRRVQTEHSRSTRVPGILNRARQHASRLRDAASRLLDRRTTTPDRCWFAVWTGFGALSLSVGDAPTFELPNRQYFLFAGPIRAAQTSLEDTPFRQSPNLWWPEDHAWCVATEIDFMSSTSPSAATASRNLSLRMTWKHPRSNTQTGLPGPRTLSTRPPADRSATMASRARSVRSDGRQRQLTVTSAGTKVDHSFQCHGARSSITRRTPRILDNPNRPHPVIALSQRI